jgi:hypothetical protein
VSDAEESVLASLEALVPGDWPILHSLWLKNHPFKAHAEVDFILITDLAVLLLEVKGGVVWRDADGMWHFQTKSGSRTDIRREGPIDQVRGAFYTIKKHLQDLGKLDLFHDYVWGYGVITPECVVSIPASDTSVEPHLWLDLRGYPASLGTFLDGITEYWRERCREIKRSLGIPESTLHTVIPPRLRNELKLLLRPVIQPVRGIGVHARQAEEELRRLTVEQYRALDFAAGNDRIVLVGAAGTGKTVLAVEQALREAERCQGGKVLFTCFTRLLADTLAERLRGTPHQGCVEVGTYHQVMMALLRRAGLEAAVPEDWQGFNERLEDLVLGAVERLEESGSFSPYRYLVIDEGQDLLHPAFFQSLGLLLQGGIERGRWLISLDPGQTLFADQFERELHERLLILGGRVTLAQNCRNTRQIAAYVSGLSGVGAMPAQGAEGPDVKIIYYDDEASYRKLLRSTVNSTVGDLEQGRLPPGEVVILTPDRAFLPAEMREAGYFVRPVADASPAPPENVIRVATVHAFKGLEAGCIILVGLNDLDSSVARRILYVGASRARTVLRILLPRCCSEQVQAKLAGVLEALAGRGTTPRGSLF